MEGLYENIGGKIKSWAITIFVIEAIAAVISGLVLLFSDAALAGLLTIVLGPLVAWIGSWLLYGFGELIETNAANESNTREILKYLKKQAAGEQTNDEAITRIIAPKAPVLTNKPVPGGWKCTCGRNHADYESSCVCGVTKREIKLKELQK